MQPKNGGYRNDKNLQSAQSLNRLDQPGIADNLQSQRRCRICLQEQGNLIQLPCACLGQIGLVHEECFTKWVGALRNDRYALRSHGQSLFHISNDIYEIPCEICRSNIKIQMKQQRKCFKCKDIKKADKCMSLFCILFMIAVIGVVLFLCITNLVNSDSDGVRKLIIIIIMVVFVVTLGCLIKRQISRMMTRDITKLKIVTGKEMGDSKSTSKNDNNGHLQRNQYPYPHQQPYPFPNNLNSPYQNNMNNPYNSNANSMNNYPINQYPNMGNQYADFQNGRNNGNYPHTY